VLNIGRKRSAAIFMLLLNFNILSRIFAQSGNLWLQFVPGIGIGVTMFFAVKLWRERRDGRDLLSPLCWVVVFALNLAEIAHSVLFYFVGVGVILFAFVLTFFVREAEEATN